MNQDTGQKEMEGVTSGLDDVPPTTAAQPTDVHVRPIYPEEPTSRTRPRSPSSPDARAVKPKLDPSDPTTSTPLPTTSESASQVTETPDEPNEEPEAVKDIWETAFSRPSGGGTGESDWDSDNEIPNPEGMNTERTGELVGIVIPPRYWRFTGFGTLTDHQIHAMIMADDTFERYFWASGVWRGKAISVLKDVRRGSRLMERFAELRRDRPEWAEVTLEEYQKITMPRPPFFPWRDLYQNAWATSGAVEIEPKVNKDDQDAADKEILGILDEWRNDIMLLTRTLHSKYYPGKTIYRVTFHHLRHFWGATLRLDTRGYGHNILPYDPFDDYYSGCNHDKVLINNLVVQAGSSEMVVDQAGPSEIVDA